jgi:hypothetical protein
MGVWDSCLADNMDQQLLSVQKHLSSKHYRNLFSTVLAVSVFGSGAFSVLLYIQTDTDLTLRFPFPSFLSCFLTAQVSNYQS